MPKRTDANQAEIVTALRLAGADVLDLSKVGKGCPDLLVHYRGIYYLVEIKNPQGFGRLTKRQQEWHKNWRGPITVAYSAEQALRAIGALSDGCH